mgnify:CR=1 FL=1
MKYNDISRLPFEEINTVSSNHEGEPILEAVQAFVTKYNIKSSWKWLAPQLLAHLATYKIPKSDQYRDVQAHPVGIDPMKFLHLNIGTNPRELGLWKMLTQVPRGMLMDKQTAPEHLQVCGLVPLYMAAQKKFHGIPYSAWNMYSMHHLMENALYEAICIDPPDYPINVFDILEARNIGLQYTAKDGTIKSRNPQTYQHTL